MPSIAIKLECIGDNNYQQCRLYNNIIKETIGKGIANTYFKIPSPWWVAEIVGFSDKYKFARVFLKGHKDYSEANSIGSRGVYMYYHLDNNKVYDINEPISWKRNDRYFAKVEDGELIRISEESVMQWLKKKINSV